MSKYKTTKKAIKEQYKKIYIIDDGGEFFRFFEPFAYATRTEGWSCDFYDAAGVCYCLGYAPIGEYLSKKLYNKYIKKLNNIYNSYRNKQTIKYETFKAKQYKIYKQLAEELQATNNGRRPQE